MQTFHRQVLSMADRHTGMSQGRLLQLSRVLMWREIRAGQLNIIILALVLAVTAATVISVFSQRLDAGMLNKSTDLLGADLRLKSTRKIGPEFYQQAQQQGLRTATTLEFPSVVMAGEAMSLAAIKAVDDGYPLRGSLVISEQAFADQPHQQTQALTGPESGSVWIEARLAALLDVSVGEQLEVGRQRFVIAGILLQESDRGGNFYSLSPRLMMHLDDVEAAGLVQTGSRVTWRMLVANGQQSGPEVLDNFRAVIKTQLASHQSLESLTDSNQALASALDKARSYLSLAAILAVLLSGIAIAMAAQDYAQHHFDTSALLRTLGASRRQVLSLFLLQLFYLSIVTSVVGLLIGTGFQMILVDMLAGLLVKDLPQASWQAWAIASVTAPMTLIGFALPHLLRLGKVSPLRVLRRELEPMGWSSWATYSLAMLAVFALSFWYTRDLWMSSILVAGGFLILLLLMLILQLMLKLAAALVPAAKFPMAPRFAWQRIVRDPRATSAQVLAFSMILMVMIIISIVRNDLLADWQKSLPDDAPNFFAMNIQQYEVEDYQHSLSSAGFKSNPLFPMIPGRLIAINELDVKAQPKLEKDPALRRDLALTWSDELPTGNKIVQGKWFDHPELLGKTAQLSIESRLAQRLGVNLHDRLTFDVAGEVFSATVSSIRSVDWGTLSPNFYMIFSADMLAQLPASYLTSFHVSADQQSQLTSLIRQYPTITLMDMSMVFVQIQSLLQQVTLAVEYLLLLVLAAGLLVLMAALHASLDERIQQGAVLRTLGASRKQLRFMQWSEFAFLGLIAGLLALAGAEVICLILYNQLFDLEYQLQWQLWLWLPWCSALLITLLAGMATRSVVSQPPVVVLRQL